MNYFEKITFPSCI